MERILPYQRAMTFLDLAIIYLACGAPLSMHYFFAANRQRDLYFAVGIVLVALCWPVAAFILIGEVRKRRITVSRSGQNDLDRRLDAIRIDIERRAFADENAAAVFEFRELFARYTGLAQAANAGDFIASENELFKLSSHAQADLATVCLERKAKNRLMIHANAASEDFVSFIAAASIDAEPGLMSSANALAKVLGDRTTVLRLGELESPGINKVETTRNSKSAIPAIVH